MTVVAVLGHGAVQFRFIFNAFRQFTFRTLIQHTHRGADNFGDLTPRSRYPSAYLYDRDRRRSILA